MMMSTPYEHLTVPPAVDNSHVVELARKLHNVWKSMKQQNYATFLQQAAQCNKKAVNGQYKVGDFVYLSNPVLKKNQVKFQQVWKGLYPLHYLPLQLSRLSSRETTSSFAFSQEEARTSSYDASRSCLSMHL
ncbi:hypothetical protein PR048_009863 [Dryococelus australis]|uniref:Uncharacterized protein n=1 Tax=Dryococelus australis TaxID=614101 RepID=A0ABQ9I154_9NEOP|nr:hypothetical protein PR048_009863 [Dryococelus australis]